MSRAVLVYRVKAFAGKTLVWLAAVLVPLQGFPAVECCCARADRQRADAENPPDRLGSRPGCCCGPSTPQRRADTRCEARPGCENAHGKASRPCCCGCSSICACSGHQSSPLPSQGAPESRRPSDDPLALPPVLADFTFDRPRQPASDERLTVVSSASERCILLCRLHL